MTAELIRPFGGAVSYMVVSEAGASVYSASPLAAEEFPQFDVNLRSAVCPSPRRLQDPLAELVKIDPKAIGVGQYQHDMPPKRLSEALDGVVEDCVNAVGVDREYRLPRPCSSTWLDWDPPPPKTLVAFREENGPFTSRRQLLKVPKLGPKAFQQCAGFLRVPGQLQPVGQHRRPSRELPGGGAAAVPDRPRHGGCNCREAEGSEHPGPAHGDRVPRRAVRRRRAHPAGCGPGAAEARPGPPG